MNNSKNGINEEVEVKGRKKQGDVSTEDEINIVPLDQGDRESFSTTTRSGRKVKTPKRFKNMKFLCSNDKSSDLSLKIWKLGLCLFFRTYTCSRCCYFSRHREALDRHWARIHGPKRCGWWCQFVFPTVQEEQCQAHLIKSHAGKAFKDSIPIGRRAPGVKKN